MLILIINKSGFWSIYIRFIYKLIDLGKCQSTRIRRKLDMWLLPESSSNVTQL